MIKMCHVRMKVDEECVMVDIQLANSEVKECY